MRDEPRFFLDTNIFLYVYDEKAPAKAAIANQLIHNALYTGNGVISFQVIQECLNGVLKRASHPIRPPDAESYLIEVLHPLLAIESSIALYSEALRLYAAGGLSWYDSLIVAAALQARCSILYSEDLQHGLEFQSLRIVNPFL